MKVSNYKMQEMKQESQLRQKKGVKLVGSSYFYAPNKTPEFSTTESQDTVSATAVSQPATR